MPDSDTDRDRMIITHLRVASLLVERCGAIAQDDAAVAGRIAATVFELATRYRTNIVSDRRQLRRGEMSQLFPEIRSHLEAARAILAASGADVSAYEPYRTLVFDIAGAEAACRALMRARPDIDWNEIARVEAVALQEHGPVRRSLAKAVLAGLAIVVVAGAVLYGISLLLAKRGDETPPPPPPDPAQVIAKIGSVLDSENDRDDAANCDDFRFEQILQLARGDEHAKWQKRRDACHATVPRWQWSAQDVPTGHGNVAYVGGTLKNLICQPSIEATSIHKPPVKVLLIQPYLGDDPLPDAKASKVDLLAVCADQLNGTYSKQFAEAFLARKIIVLSHADCDGVKPGVLVCDALDCSPP